MACEEAAERAPRAHAASSRHYHRIKLARTPAIGTRPDTARRTNACGRVLPERASLGELRCLCPSSQRERALWERWTDPMWKVSARRLKGVPSITVQSLFYLDVLDRLRASTDNGSDTSAPAPRPSSGRLLTGSASRDSREVFLYGDGSPHWALVVAADPGPRGPSCCGCCAPVCRPAPAAGPPSSRCRYKCVTGVTDE